MFMKILKFLDCLYVVKRILSWIFHTVNLAWLLYNESFRNRYSNSYDYIVRSSYPRGYGFSSTYAGKLG